MVASEFGRYELLELLGRGGMGEVWRARDTLTNRTVALKVLLPQYADDETFQKRFLREAQMAAALNEPHIVPIHNYGEIDGRLFVDMRLIEGQDLHTLLGSGPLTPARAVHVVEQVAMALDAAHEIGLVHRDVKPSNVLVGKFDFTYLIDFGIARASGDIGLTATGSTVGTWHYMAPERFNTGEADARADTYALACVLYECLTGARPFPGDSMQQQVTGHLMSPPPRPSATVSGLPHTLDMVIGTGMAKNPADRYPSTMDLARAAKAAVEGSGPTAVVTRREPETRPTPRPFVTPPPAAYQPAAYPSAPPTGRPPTPPPMPVSTPPPSTSFPPQHYSSPLYARPTPPPVGPPPPATPAPAVSAPAPKPNRKPLIIGGAVAAVVVIAAAAIGIIVGSSSSDEGSTAQTTRTTSERTTTSRSPRSSEPTTSPTFTSDGSNPTIASYIKDNNITESPVKLGDPGAPAVKLPMPTGWEPLGANTPEWAYDGIRYTGPDAADYQPSVIALMSKLTGSVDAQEIIDVAPGELYNLPGYQPGADSGSETTLSGFPAYQLGGTWVQDGKTKLVAQTTVVIPASDGLFVLQFNTDAAEGQDQLVKEATDAIDSDAEITLP